MAAGDYAEGLTKMWGEALHSAEWWFSSITILADAVVSPFLKTSLPKNQQRLNQHFQKWQSAKNNLPAHHARDINVLWADYGYITRKLFNNAKNIFKATDDEIAQAAERIKTHRTTNNLKGGNFGYLEGTVNGKKVDNKIWRSTNLERAKSEIHIFEAKEAIGSNGYSWPRITDSEYRMLNKLAKDLGAEKGKIYSHVTGELKIVSENPYCTSCQGVIQQFNEMFPNVKLILVDGVK
ncbi:deaminase domain-containing protein [Capnocytophaga canis]|uniref:deaminase domain-containing protein n=1 Tax=Capnocytophaga canis TaxID=1848903 RepID=UPI001F5139AB|nr:deaminase domain-containing protein [Capnocytophaga canis]